jgi:hypothetical protein
MSVEELTKKLQEQAIIEDVDLIVMARKGTKGILGIYGEQRRLQEMVASLRHHPVKGKVLGEILDANEYKN